MRYKTGVSFWLVLISAVGLAAQQTSAGRDQRDAYQKSKEEKAKEEKPATVPVKGKVTDRDGHPVKNCPVIFAGAKGETKTNTDDTGTFTVEVPPGRYTIKATAGGKSTSVQTEIVSKVELAPLVIDK